MSEMMGYGGMGFGGSSSSTSNLSPLAPPFTVDRWNPKPSSTPPVHATEPSFAVPVYSAFNNWQYPPQSSSSRPDLYPNCGSEIDSIRTTTLPWAQDYDYQYYGSVSDTSPSVPPVNPNVSSDSYTYLKYPNDIQNPSVAAKPYHPQASPALDNHIPTAAYNESTYDLLSSSRGDPSDGPSRVDYTQILTGLDYTQPWGSFWNGFSDEDQIKHNFCKEETNTAGSYASRNYTAQDSLSGRDEVGISFGRRESQIVSPVEDERYSAKDPRFAASISSKAYTSAINSAIPEFHAAVPHLQTDTNSWSDQKSFAPVYDSFFPSFDSCMDEPISVKKASPAVVIRPPSTVSASTAQNGFPSETVKSKNNNDHNSVSNKPTQKDPTQKDVLDHMSMTGKQFQLFEKDVPDGFTLTLDGPKGFVSVNDSSECIDHYNPSVDSPCWKGAPASRFFPSDVSDVATSQQVPKQVEIGESLNTHQTYPSCDDENSLNVHQMCFPRLHNGSLIVQPPHTVQPSSDGSPKVSCQSIFENTAYLGNGYAELGSLLYSDKVPDSSCAAREDISANIMNDASSCPKPVKSASIQRKSYTSTERAINGCNLPNGFTSGSDMKSGEAKGLGTDEGELISERGSGKFGSIADSGLHVHASPEGTSLFSLGIRSASLLPDPTKEGSKLAVHDTEFPPKLNVQMLVNTMHNLSEMLLFHYSRGVYAVPEQDQEILECVQNNISACLSKTVLNTRPMHESLSCEGVLRECKEAPGPHKGATSGRLMDFSTSSHDLSDQNSINVESRKYSLSGKDAERFPSFVPLGDDPNIAKDDSLVRALKEVLQENFDGEEEMKPETLLFKNLWLEAEAALCSVNFRSRYNHVKSELEKGKSKKPKDLVENTKTSEDSCNTNTTHEAARDGSVLGNSLQESLDQSTLKIDDDIDDSVLARLRILKSRGDDSKFSNKGNFVATGFMPYGNPQLHFGDDKCTPLQTKDVVESTKSVDEVVAPSVCVSPNLSTTTMEAPDRDGSFLEDPVQRKIIDDVDASVLARLRILKCRGQGSDSMGNEEIVMDSFGSFAHDVDRKLKKFGVSATEDPVNSYGDNRSGPQLSSGWGGSSDWEHVLKDEVVYQKW